MPVMPYGDRPQPVGARAQECIPAGMHDGGCKRQRDDGRAHCLAILPARGKRRSGQTGIAVPISLKIYRIGASRKVKRVFLNRL